MKIWFDDDRLEQWMATLEKQTIAKILRTIDLLEQFGNQLGMPHSRKVDKRLFELRVRGKQEVRLLYMFHKNQAVILHGFVKKSERIPNRDLDRARTLLKALDEV